MTSDYIELQRCRGEETASEIAAVLAASDIPHRIASSATRFDLTADGVNNEAEIIVLVPSDIFEQARSTLESLYLDDPLPEGHFLESSSNDELLDILSAPNEWSPFDVAHARKLSQERGLDSEAIDKLASHRSELLIDDLKKGRQAPAKLIYSGWVAAIVGGVVGIGIAWSLLYLKEKTPEGEFYTYDQKARATGGKMLIVAVPMSIWSLWSFLQNLLIY